MKHPASILLLSLLVIIAAGCKDKESSPIQEALGAYILQGQEGTFRLYRIEKIDSTTFRTEFERRQNVFELKLQAETIFYQSYTMDRKPKNAARHWDAMQGTLANLKGLDSLRTTLEGRLDEIAYYDYVFSGRAETDSQATDFADAYASLTPNLKVIALTSERKDLHKSGGRAIPGYVQLFGKEEE